MTSHTLSAENFHDLCRVKANRSFPRACMDDSARLLICQDRKPRVTLAIRYLPLDRGPHVAQLPGARPQRRSGPWSPRTGAPEASATRDRIGRARQGRSRRRGELRAGYLSSRCGPDMAQATV
jgi:hypothetical protein